MLYIYDIVYFLSLKIRHFTLNGNLDSIDSPPDHDPIWIWSYLNMMLFGLDQKRPEKISPSGHAQIHPIRPIDIPTYVNVEC